MSVAYVTPAGAGTQSGNSFANAAPWSLLQAVHDAATSGDSIHLLAMPGYIAPATPWQWSKRVAVGGYNLDGSRGRAVIAGTRSWPWPTNGTWTDSGSYVAASVGENVFQYKDNAASSGGCLFDWLGFTNVGTPFRPLFDSSAVLGLITVQNVKTFNTSGVVYIESSADGQCSITASDVTALAYSRGAFRAFGDMFLDRIYGDARNQFHDPSTNLFGAHVQDAIAGVTLVGYNAHFRNIALLNHRAAPPAGSSKDPATTSTFLQGDSIVCEENTVLAESYNLYLTGNGDRGIDLKCAVPEGTLHHIYSAGNGYDIAAHDDTVETWVTDSYLGSTFRASYDTRKSSPLQASGHLHATRCLMEQISAVPSVFLGAAYGTVQPAHTQSGVTIPQRVGAVTVKDSIIQASTGISEYLMSAGGSPVSTPTYSRGNDTRVVSI